MPAWNDWYHCMCNTYGTWLPGDSRGFRTYRGKHPIPFDYRHRPPKGWYDSLFDRSKRLMSRPAVILRTVEQRRRALDEIVASLLRHGIPVAVGAVDRIHLHVLARCKDQKPRHWMGRAKRDSSHYCNVAGLTPVGGIWGAACECKPIADEHHFNRALGYIPDHAKLGAEIYVGTIPNDNPLADFDPNDLLIE
jgi:hypothetical protein